jgi:hypothetical protein
VNTSAEQDVNRASQVRYVYPLTPRIIPPSLHLPGAIVIPVNFRVFDKLALINFLFDRIHRSEMIVLPVNFSFSWLSSSMGHAKAKLIVGKPFHEQLNQRALTYAIVMYQERDNLNVRLNHRAVEEATQEGQPTLKAVPTPLGPQKTTGRGEISDMMFVEYLYPVCNINPNSNLGPRR